MANITFMHSIERTCFYLSFNTKFINIEALLTKLEEFKDNTLLRTSSTCYALTHTTQKIFGKFHFKNFVYATRRTEIYNKGVFGKVFSLISYNFITQAPICIKLVSKESYKHVFSFPLKIL